MSANVLVFPFDGSSWLSRITRKQRLSMTPYALDSEPNGTDLILSDLTIGTAVTTAADAELTDVAEAMALSLAHGATMLERRVVASEALPGGAAQVTLRGLADEPVSLTLTVQVVSADARPDGQQQVELSARLVVATESVEAAQALTTALLASLPHHVEKPLVVSRAPRVSENATTPATSLDQRKRWFRWKVRP